MRINENTYWKSFRALVLVGILFVFFTSFLIHLRTAYAREVPPFELQTFSSHSRLLFRVGEDVPVEVKKSAKGFEVFFKGITLVDFGAPLGVEREWASKWEKLGDARFDQVVIEETPAGVKVSGVWKYLSGDDAPADPAMEHFDYRTGNPVPRFVMDFWQKKGPTVAEARKAAIRARRISELKQAKKDAQARQGRQIASQKIIHEVEDLGYFCRKPLSEDLDVFLHFSPVHQSVNWKAYLPTVTPDAEYSYSHSDAAPAKEGAAKAGDGEYVSLALKLYRQGNFALTLRTLDFLVKEHPKSSYLEEMTFLRGNALLKLGHKERAHEIFRRIRLESPKSPMAFPTTLYLVYQDIEAGAHLAALENFFWLIDQYGTHPLAWIFHLGAAEMHYKLRETPRAAKEYEWVAKNAPDSKAKAQGALRVGDIYLDRRQYAQGLAAYFQGLNRFEAEAGEFPSVHLNRAESLYWLGQYDQAKKVFEEFNRDFPSYPEGWRATYRLGEIAARKTSRGQAEDASRWYRETVNRFPHSPGATLARIRMVECGDHGGFDIDGINRFFVHEASKFDGDGQVSMDRYSDFSRLSHLRAQMALKDYEAATLTAIRALQAGPAPRAREVLEEDLEKLFRMVIVTLLSEGRKDRALAFYQEHYSSIPKMPGGPTSKAPDYLLDLSQAASDLGLGTLAQEITRDHQSALSRRRGERQLASGELETRLKKSEKAYASARALWISDRDKSKKRIGDLLEEVADESPFSYGKEIILGLMSEAEGRKKDALSHAIRALLLTPSGSSDEKTVIKSWVASLQVSVGETEPAVVAYRDLQKRTRTPASSNSGGDAEAETRAVALGVPPVPELPRLIQAEAELLISQGKWGEAAAAYEKAIEAGLGGNQARYEYARLLRKTGESSNEAKARETFEALAQSKESDFWTRLAREALANEQITTAREGI